jgi:excisionase family DNA binding protein
MNTDKTTSPPAGGAVIAPDQVAGLLKLVASLAQAVPAQQHTKYLTAPEAAAYLRTTVQGIYSLVKRRRLRPMPGRPGRLLFTRDALDAYLSGKKTR